MKKFILSAGLMLAAAVTFAGAPKGETKDANASEAKEASSTKAQSYYWFDANNGQYLGHKESSGCSNSSSTPCAEGYEEVTNPSDPQQPTSDPDVIATGTHP